jgi:hypothetical protein
MALFFVLNEAILKEIIPIVWFLYILNNIAAFL